MNGSTSRSDEANSREPMARGHDSPPGMQLFMAMVGVILVAAGVLWALIAYILSSGGDGGTPWLSEDEDRVNLLFRSLARSRLLWLASSDLPSLSPAERHWPAAPARQRLSRGASFLDG